MTINFDLISDLYLHSIDKFSWEGKATSLFCIVAGNISSDHDVLFEFLENISQYYEAVFFIDGDLEHYHYNGDFDKSYASIRENLFEMEKVFFLHENIVILPNVTLLATNGWTTFDFTSNRPVEEILDFMDDRGSVPLDISDKILKLAVTDQHYMLNSVEACQDMEDVTNVIVISNSVPKSEFIVHDDDYDGTILGDMAGNKGIVACLENDTKKKITTWLFGKYPGDVDYTVDGVRFVNNSGQSKDLSIYYPKIIKP